MNLSTSPPAQGVSLDCTRHLRATSSPPFASLPPPPVPCYAYRMASINARAYPIAPPPRSSTHIRALRPIDFPSEELVPETKRHLEARTVLYLILKEALPGATVGSEQFIYYDAADPRRCLAPDVFVKLGAPDQPF